MILLVVIILLYVEYSYSPKLEYIEKSDMLILHYNTVNSRSWCVVFRF